MYQCFYLEIADNDSASHCSSRSIRKSPLRGVRVFERAYISTVASKRYHTNMYNDLSWTEHCQGNCATVQPLWSQETDKMTGSKSSAMQKSKYSCNQSCRGAFHTQFPASVVPELDGRVVERRREFLFQFVGLGVIQL